jgi:uncharacterized repeat protein (TIGR03803 family)
MRKYAILKVNLRSLSLCVVVILLSGVFAAAQHETVLYSFQGRPDGEDPEASVIADNLGNLYGTTRNGGSEDAGTVFELSLGSNNLWTETLLYSFTSGADGAAPVGSLVLDSQGNLYGTASNGGNSGCLFGCGTVFELSPRYEG